MDNEAQIEPQTASLSPFYPPIIHRLYSIVGQVGNFSHHDKVAWEAILSYGASQSKREKQQVIHLSTVPTTTILSISIKIYIKIIVIGAVDKWITSEQRKRQRRERQEI